MIALVAGEVAVRRGDHVVLETAGGVGYRLAVSAETLRQVPAVGRPVSLHAHLVVRDDTMSLYGFATEEERDLFLHAARRPGRRPEGRARDPQRRHAARARRRARRRRRRALPGRARASASARPSGSSSSCARRSRPVDGSEPAILVTRGDDPRRLARDGLLELGFPPAEVDALLAVAEGESAEALLQSALKAARR